MVVGIRFKAMVTEETKSLLWEYAARYETEKFIDGDPSWFMHQVEDPLDRETIAFVAAALSYGSRSQFMPKIEMLLNYAEGRPYRWVKESLFEERFSADNHCCFYRMQQVAHLYEFLSSYSLLLKQYGSLGEFVRSSISSPEAIEALQAITAFFAAHGNGRLVPGNTESSCKRMCMFMRWMVRDQSPVDLGLWSGIVDRRTLIMPMDTHVVKQSVRLGLLSSPTTSMSNAQRLTRTMAEVFPDDPVRGDFALFGYGVNHKI